MRSSYCSAKPLPPQRTSRQSINQHVSYRDIVLLNSIHHYKHSVMIFKMPIVQKKSNTNRMAGFFEASLEIYLQQKFLI